MHSFTSACLSIPSSAHRLGCSWDSRVCGGGVHNHLADAVKIPHVNQMPSGRQWYEGLRFAAVKC